MKRLLSCTSSEMLKMDGQELKQAILASEGRTVMTETVVAIEPLLGDLTNAELAVSFGSDMVLLNCFDCNNPEIKGLPACDNPVEKLKEEQLDLKNQVSALKQKLLAYQAKEIDVTPELVKVFDSELSGNEPRELMNLLLERGAKICAIFAGNDEEGYRYVIGSHSEDVRVISKKLNEAFQGRGGGKPQMVQGSLKGTAKNISEIL